MRSTERIGQFRACFAQRIECRAADLVETIHRETGLPRSPHFADVELLVASPAF